MQRAAQRLTVARTRTSVCHIQHSPIPATHALTSTTNSPKFLQPNIYNTFANNDIADDRRYTAPLPSQDGSTPLHLAAERGHAAVAQLLVAAGTPLDAPNKVTPTAPPGHNKSLPNSTSARE